MASALTDQLALSAKQTLQSGDHILALLINPLMDLLTKILETHFSILLLQSGNESPNVRNVKKEKNWGFTDFISEVLMCVEKYPSLQYHPL